MIGGKTTPELRDGYSKRAQQLLSQQLESFAGLSGGRETVLAELMDSFATYHTRHMILDEEQVPSLFVGFDELSYGKVTTPGECVNPTESFQIVASLR